MARIQVDLKSPGGAISLIAGPATTEVALHTTMPGITTKVLLDDVFVLKRQAEAASGRASSVHGPDLLAFASRDAQLTMAQAEPSAARLAIRRGRAASAAENRRTAARPSIRGERALVVPGQRGILIFLVRECLAKVSVLETQSIAEIPAEFHPGGEVLTQQHATSRSD